MRNARHSSIVGGFDFVSGMFELAERLERRMPLMPAEILVPIGSRESGSFHPDFESSPQIRRGDMTHVIPRRM
jgi:hypothetical protein